ncbi:MAG: EAL domain-containing protein [Alphaproteobacteria bacterium]|nr:EAL domain-containing protein [Alphaproteobacteria bacterium]
MTADHGRHLAFAFAWADIIIEVEAGRITFADGATEPLLGCVASSLVGKPIDAVFSPTDRVLINEVYALAGRHGRIPETVAHLAGPNGMHPRVSLVGHSLGGSPRLFLAMRALLRGPEVHGQSVDRDQATGLYSCQDFQTLAVARLKAMGAAEQPADLTLVSISGLNAVCETMKEGNREAMMAAVGALMRASSLDGDSAALVDDDKFGLLSSGDVSATLEKQVADLVSAMAPEAEVEISMAAITVGDASTISEEDLAKGLLYTLQKFQATESAVNLQTLVSRVNSLVGDTCSKITGFKEIVTRQLFNVALQPVISLNTGMIHHFEALCRFQSSGIDASPYQLINFAEETGQIHQFDLSMAAKVVHVLKELPCNNDMYRIAVNVSGYSVFQEAYLEGLFELLARNPWTSERLIFEITESSRMPDLDRANSFIQKLRATGHEVCLDDFGAGAASFQYLSTLDVDVVKLDGSAVKNAQRSAKGRAFLTALTELCRRLSVATVAEMVDTRETLDFVRDCGCDYVQGWLFGKPSTDIKDFIPYKNRHMIQRR